LAGSAGGALEDAALEAELGSALGGDADDAGDGSDDVGSDEDWADAAGSSSALGRSRGKGTAEAAAAASLVAGRSWGNGTVAAPTAMAGRANIAAISNRISMSAQRAPLLPGCRE